MASANDGFSKRYRKALNSYLESGSEEDLTSAYDLGRRALTSNVSLLDVAGIHQDALSNALKKPAKKQPAKAKSKPKGEEADGLQQKVEAASRFLFESLSPFVLVHLRDQEANLALRQMNMMLEEEAKRVAHALHDEAASLLAMVYLELSKAGKEGFGEQRLASIRAHLDTVREQLRRLSHEIHPPILDQIGLVPAVRFLADGVEKRSGLQVTVKSSGDKGYLPLVSVTIYRAVQEALNNINKHADAKKVLVKLWHEKGMIHCTIKDDGKGFDADKQRKKGSEGLGLTAMQERTKALGGRLNISSAPGKGTTVEIALPDEE
jgi:signal transduction histidine kinase